MQTQKQFIAWPTGQQDPVRARIAAHKEADEIAQGVGYAQTESGVRACAVGCSLDKYDHDEYSRVLGVDLRIARLVDRIHESLTFEDAVKWPGRVAAALVPGADTTLAADRFMVCLLRQGVCGKSAQCAAVATLYDARLQGQEPSSEVWSQARSNAAAYAYAAAADAAAYAYAAADAAADADAYAAADAAAYADAYAAADAAAYAYAAAAAYAYAAADAAADAYAAAAAAARKAFWRDAASALIEILSRCEAPK